MSKHKQPTHGHEHQNAAGHSAKQKKKLIHHDWRFWTAIVLMMLAMAAYVMTLNESVLPGVVVEPQVPIATE